MLPYISLLLVPSLCCTSTHYFLFLQGSKHALLEGVGVTYFFSFRAVGSEYVKFVFSLCLLIAVRGRGCFYTYYGLHHVVGECSEVLKFSSVWGLWLEFGCSPCLPCSELWRWPFPVSASQYGLRFWALPALVVLKLDIVHVFPDLMSVDEKKLNSSSVRKSGKQVNVLAET